MKPEIERTPRDIWSLLPEDGQKLATVIAQGRGSALSDWLIDGLSKNETLGFDREKGMKALREHGVLEEVTLIQEMQEQLQQIPLPREIILLPVHEVPTEKLPEKFQGPTEEERKYLRLASEIREYDKNRKKNPAKNKPLERPRYRLTDDFQAFLEQRFNSMAS